LTSDLLFVGFDDQTLSPPWSFPFGIRLLFGKKIQVETGMNE
jgi:hypothetical protein